MQEKKIAEMSESERKIAEWVWANPGIGSMKLVKLCMSNYGWKQSTVFTLIKRMRQKEVLVSQDAKLMMTIDRQTYYSDYAKQMIATTYQGSLYAFLKDYFYQTYLSKEEAGRLMNLLRNHTK